MPSPVENDTIVAGRYTLERCISTGGIGSLWLARDEQTGESCALRLADAAGQNVDILELAARYRTEFEIIERIRCENVVDVMDYGDWRGMPYLVSEYLQGEDLATRLKREGEFSTERAYRLLAQTGRALARAHSAGIVHGDVTPENILITEEGPQGIAKIHNFSLTQRTSEKIVGTVTRMGSFLALPHYSSPERASGAELDNRSDLWSLAVIAFECLTGRKPFESNVYGDLIAKILCGPIPPLSVGSCNNPAALQAWWERASARDPSKRFQTPKQLSDALGQVFDVPIVYVPESNSNGVATSNPATPAAMLGTPEQSQVARRTQSFPRIPRRSTPLGIGAVNLNLGSLPPATASSMPSAVSQAQIITSAHENRPTSIGPTSAPECSQASLGPNPRIESGQSGSRLAPEGVPSVLNSISAESGLRKTGREEDSEFGASEAPTTAYLQPASLAIVPFERPDGVPAPVAPGRKVLVAVAALLVLAGALLIREDFRAWLKNATSGSNSTSSSENLSGGGAVLLSAPPSATGAAIGSPIVPMPSKVLSPNLTGNASHEAGLTSATAPAESSMKGSSSKVSSKRAASDAPKPSPVTTMRAPASNPNAVVATPSVAPTSAASHDSDNAATTKPAKPVATTNSRDYGI